MEKDEIQKQVKELMNMWIVPTELFNICSHIYWLHELDAADIEDTARFIWSFCQINKGKLNKDKFKYLIDNVEYGLLHPMEKLNPSIVGTEEYELRYKAIELFINMSCEVAMTDDFIYILQAENINERIKLYQKHPDYKNMFTYKSREEVWFNKYLEQAKAGINPDDIKVDEEVVNKEYELNLNKIREKDKRVRYRDIEMIDADTKETVHIFNDRNECIEMTGISKARLSQIITSCKDPNHNSWHTWKDKNNNRRYYFKEKYKE